MSATATPQRVPVPGHPEGCETPLTTQVGWQTPSGAFYTRSHFLPTPVLAAQDWQLSVEGAVERPLTLTLEELQALPSHTVIATLECAGNNRSVLDPPADGIQFGCGAVSTAEWRGVSLATVLHEAGLRSDAQEVLGEGTDRGHEKSLGQEIPFERSLPLPKALDPDTLLAYEMDGQPLPHEHGFPARLIVPGWYGMASVKWLAKLQVLDQPYAGFFQKTKYIYEVPGQESTPVRTMRVKATFVQPADGDTVTAGAPVTVRGYAWSGEGEVSGVAVSTDGGTSWQDAALTAAPGQWAWCEWSLDWTPGASGHATLLVRATDAAGNAQPLDVPWNRLGYGNNGVQQITVNAR